MAIALLTGPILSVLDAINSVINSVNSSVGGAVGGLTANNVVKAATTTTLSNSSITDNGTNVTIAEPLILTGQTSTPGALTGTLTNAPATGNAQTWLAVSINGVAHFIPAWHV
jgi:hypothetical protein